MIQEEAIAKLLQIGWRRHQAELGLRAGFRCEYCGRDLLRSVDDYDAWQIDHVVPVSKGGAHDLSNLALCCKTCNFMKRHWLPAQGLDPVGKREATIAKVRELVEFRRARKQAELDVLRAMFRPGCEPCRNS